MMDYEINNLKDYIEVINKVCLDTSRYFNNPFISFYNYNKFQNTELEKYFSAIIKNDKKRFENNPEKNETDLNKKFDTFSDDQIKFFYRGHCNSEYKLSPSVFRGNNWDYEDVYYHEMIVQCPNHFQFDSHLDKLVTMQHYDCPYPLKKAFTIFNKIMIFNVTNNQKSELLQNLLFFDIKFCRVASLDYYSFK